MSSVYAIDKERLLFVAISGPFDNTRAIIGSYSLSVLAVPTTVPVYSVRFEVHW